VNKVDSNLFHIFGTDDIYFTLDMWAKLSSRPIKRKPVDNLTSNIPVAGDVKEAAAVVPETLPGTNIAS
jgi:hypothetical protein